MRGVFKTSIARAESMPIQSQETALEDVLLFDANNSSGSMKGHANSNEIRPYSIGLLPLIAS